jgi:hypothetical protein
MLFNKMCKKFLLEKIIIMQFNETNSIFKISRNKSFNFLQFFILLSEIIKFDVVGILLEFFERIWGFLETLWKNFK